MLLRNRHTGTSLGQLRASWNKEQSARVERTHQHPNVTICWPSAEVETLNNLAADRYYSVLEWQGVVPFEKIRPETRKK
jgi:hypothetical protein